MLRAAALLLVLPLSACSGGSAAGPPEDSPRRFADYDGTSSPRHEQCASPAAERNGGWLCHRDE